MAKLKTSYFCQSCGAQHAKWMGKCSQCNEWNTLVEEVKSTTSSTNKKDGVITTKSTPKLLQEITIDNNQRLLTNSKELNRVLGGGIVSGSLILLGGEPGIGKSTLLLQMALKMRSRKIIYVSGEESEQQIKLRAERIHPDNDSLLLYAETDLLEIIKACNTIEPNILVIDSIQTIQHPQLDSAPGSVSQIRESTNTLLRFAKSTNCAVFIVGHITKEGHIAGPKLLEHMVDVVLQFEGDRNYNFRILRGLKNRFGATSEIGIYEMVASGLAEVNNPSELFITAKEEALSGAAIGVSLEGNRVLLIETQALVSTAVYGTPQRSATGYDNRRLNMLLAVLEKRAQFNLGQKDVFLNIVGGLRIDEPAVDLAVILAIMSSHFDIPIHPKKCFAAEVGLSGELRPVTQIEIRIAEAEKLGFDQIYISKFNKVSQKNHSIELVQAAKLEDVFKSVFK